MSFKILRLNHIAIATKRRDALVALFQEALNCSASDKQPQPEHGVYTTFVDLGNSKIELLEQLGADSPIAGFLEKNPEKIHHLCFEVDNIAAAAAELKKRGVKVLGDGPKIGAHGKPVVFLHPKDTGGLLIELEEQ